jgi:multidrug efflux system membrane fusion protein
MLHAVDDDALARLHALEHDALGLDPLAELDLAIGDLVVGAASGTIRARAKFDNADRALLPGMFVSVRLAEATERNELLIPDRALGFDQSKKFVYVVGADSKVAYREVELGKRVQAQRVVLKGLQAGERVIVDGVQHVRPNTVVAGKKAAPDAEFVAAK